MKNHQVISNRLWMAFAGFVCATTAWAQGQGPTPPAIAPGNPASSYALSGIDNINYFNGNLNIHIRLVSLSGRGQGAPSLILPIQQRWGVYPGLLLPITVDEFRISRLHAGVCDCGNGLRKLVLVHESGAGQSDSDVAAVALSRWHGDTAGGYAVEWHG
jgi:hypothetical protein